MSEKFDQKEYIKDWKKSHMKRINMSYNSDFVDSFKQACKILGVTQSSVFRKAMEETIEKSKNI